ncbi:MULTISPECIES: helix-turn-helix domain-containing protein [Lactococcus]|jgi:transcriptional regulator with XRE-family HTH domain|uniref:helix-turn-helix domain-containing protein n=1 Tax=Lactococcus TaxID=1357 RepID=UPI0018A9C4ED|nr:MULTISPECIES: helix-turn-helix transcriptional regulator [Lactococcus]MCA2382286.1 helix-turn-helix transcriptional regulator [Lactococcus sp. SK2-659]MDT2879442.1 helix-turn-helix transcriptional regulator [Lactococcus lactis]
MELTLEIKTALRKKRAELDLPKHVIAEKLGLTPLTYGRIESNKQKFNVQPTTYQKITQWLATDTEEITNN